MPIQCLNTITLVNGLCILKQARKVKAANIYKTNYALYEYLSFAYLFIQQTVSAPTS